jgi:hypothetical protein
MEYRGRGVFKLNLHPPSFQCTHSISTFVARWQILIGRTMTAIHRDLKNVPCNSVYFAGKSRAHRSLFITYTFVIRAILQLLYATLVALRPQDLGRNSPCRDLLGRLQGHELRWQLPQGCPLNKQDINSMHRKEEDGRYEQLQDEGVDASKKVEAVLPPEA